MGRRVKGEGSIWHNDELDRWIGQITLPNGKKRTKYGKTQKEVKDWLLKQRNAIKTNTLLEDEKITLSAYLDRYMEDVAKHTLRPKTLESYEYLIRLHIKPELGAYKLSQLRPDHIQKLYAAKLDSGLSRRTVQYIHGVLHKVLNQAMKWGLVYRNVCDLVDPPSGKRPAPTTWTIEQAKKFLETTKDSRFFPMYCLAFIGLREGEILGLHLEDFSRTEHTIRIRHAVQYLIGKGLVITEPKTEKAKRTIKLPDFIYAALVTHTDSLNRNQGLMFTTGNGTPFSPRNFFRDFKENTELAGLPEIRFHDLRHTAISFMINVLKIPPSVVQQIVGHSTAMLTLDVYTHEVPEMQDEAAAKMSSIFT